MNSSKPQPLDLDAEEYRKRLWWPFALFMLWQLAYQIFESAFGWEHPQAAWWRQAPEQVIYPLQTLSCLALLIYWRRSYHYNFAFKSSLLGAGFGLLGIAVWLLPNALYLGGAAQIEWLGIAARPDGFAPEMLGDSKALIALAYALRFLRAVVVVAWLEELFWRGFILNWLNKKPQAPIGSYAPGMLSILVQSLMFAAVHASVDYTAAVLYAILAGLLLRLSRSLGALIVMHAVANLLLGIYAIYFKQSGLW